MQVPVPSMWFCTCAICHCVALPSAKGTTINQNSRSFPVLTEQIQPWPGASPGYIRAAAQRCGPYPCAQSSSASTALEMFSIWCLATILCSLCDLCFCCWVAATPYWDTLSSPGQPEETPARSVHCSEGVQSLLCLTGISRSYQIPGSGSSVQQSSNIWDVRLEFAEAAVAKPQKRG